MTASELMQALSAAGAPMEAIIIAVQALEAKDAEIAARDAAAAAKRAEHAEWKRLNRAGKRVSMDSPRTQHGQSTTPSLEVPPNDIYSNPPPKPSPAADAPCPLAGKVIEAWNEGPAKRGATAAKPLDAGRRKALSLRVREHGEDLVFEAIRNVAGSRFHCGQNDRGWRANIGWLLKSPENFQKALELQPAQSGGGANEPTDLVQHILSRRAA